MKAKSENTTTRMAVIRVRGVMGVKKDISKTLDMLNLDRKNYCTIVDATPSYLGMIKKTKDYATYGEISDDVFKELVEKRGEEYKGVLQDRKGIIEYKHYFTFNGKKYRKYFRLNPPKKGFGRKGIKRAFSVGGALGYRGDKINDLIKRML